MTSRFLRPALLVLAFLLLWGCVQKQTTLQAIHQEMEVTLEPGIWHGFILGPSSDPCAYVPEVTPLEPAKNGAFIEKCVVQPEFNGEQWNDVLRVSIPSQQSRMTVHIRVFRIEAGR